MYPNLENALKPFAMKEGRTVKLILLMSLLLGLLSFLAINSGASWESDKEMFLVIGGFAIVYLIALPTGRMMASRRMKKLLEGFSEEKLHRIELECAQMKPICGVIVTSHALISEMNLIPVSDIVWIYEQNNTIKGAATMNFLKLVDKNQKNHRILLSTKAGPFRKANQESVHKIEELLRKYNPGFYWGYSKELAKMYRKDFTGMVARVEEGYTKGE